MGGVVYQHGPRHLDVLVKDLGLEHGNSGQTPAAHDATGDDPARSNQTQSDNCRSQVAGCFFPSQDNIHRELSVPTHAHPHTAEPGKVEKACQIPEARKAVGTNIPFWNLCEEVTTYPDSDWSGCKEARKPETGNRKSVRSRHCVLKPGAVQSQARGQRGRSWHQSASVIMKHSMTLGYVIEGAETVAVCAVGRGDVVGLWLMARQVIGQENRPR